MPWMPSRPALGVGLPFKRPQLSSGRSMAHQERRGLISILFLSRVYTTPCGHTEQESAPTHREDESRAGLGWRQRKESSRLRRTVSKVTQPVVPSKGRCVFEVATLCIQCKVGGTVVCPGQPDQVGGYPELDGPCLLFCF